MSNYLIEFSITHLILTGAYWLFLRNEHQYSKMRSFLIASTALSLIMPLLKLPSLISYFWTSNHSGVTQQVVMLQPAGTITPAAESFDYSLLLYPYLLISAILLFKFISNLIHLIRLEHTSQHIAYEEFNVLKTHEIEGSFTFFNWIFVGQEVFANQQEYTAILKHEKAHAELGHTYDLIFIQMFRIVFWWLPTTRYLQKEIKKIHEYQADAYALKAFNLDWYSSILISSTLKSNGLSLASSFHDGLILKRLKAMKQTAKKSEPLEIGRLIITSSSTFYSICM